MTAPVEHALELATGGNKVFPCGLDKAPLVKHGFRDAVRDHDQIRRWWNRWPDALVAVATGEKLVVLDLDLQHEDARSWYETNRRQLPSTRTHITRSGGRHLVFKPHPRVRCSTSKIGPHIDTRGSGGCIIWWPAHGHEVLYADLLAEVPEFLLSALDPPKPARPAKIWQPRDDDDERIASALAAVSADDRQTWIEVGMALHAHLGDAGRYLWDRWSETSSKYNAVDQDRVWRSFGNRSGVTIGTLFHHARRAGWVPPPPSEAERRVWFTAGYFICRFRPSRAWRLFRAWCERRAIL